MLTFLVQQPGDMKKRVVLVMEPRDVKKMTKENAPVIIDLAQDPRTRIPVAIILGYTPDAGAVLAKIRGRNKGTGSMGKINSTDLMQILNECGDLPVKDRPRRKEEKE